MVYISIRKLKHIWCVRASLVYDKKTPCCISNKTMVGVEGFKPPTSSADHRHCTRGNWRAIRLRYTPTREIQEKLKRNFKKSIQLSWQLPTFPNLRQVSSVQLHFTSGFGMGPGGSTALSHHYNYIHLSLFVSFIEEARRACLTNPIAGGEGFEPPISPFDGSAFGRWLSPCNRVIKNKFLNETYKRSGSSFFYAYLSRSEIVKSHYDVIF